MEERYSQITGVEEKRIEQYGTVLGKFIDPEIIQYLPGIGFRKRPKIKRDVAEEISNARDFFQDKLGVGWNWSYKGRWELEMIGANERPGSSYCDEGYWWILPLNSERKDILIYLANEVLPKVFNNKKFVVRDKMIPCDGDIGWDCR